MVPKHRGLYHPPRGAPHAHMAPTPRYRFSRATDSSTPPRLLPWSPQATYGGHAAAVRQSRLGQALPGERKSRNKVVVVVSATITYNINPSIRCPHAPLFPSPRGPSFATRSETRAHPGACMRPMMAAVRQQKRERG